MRCDVLQGGSEALCRKEEDPTVLLWKQKIHHFPPKTFLNIISKVWVWK